MFLVIYKIYDLHCITNDLIKLEYERHKMISKADELRQSSDDLTRMARAYLITDDEKFKDNYHKILDIREGKAARPKHYEDIYWDLSEELRKKYHPDEKPISLEEEMQALPYSKYELEKLHQSKQNSDKLALLEMEAFRQQQKQPDNPDNIMMLHSPEYYRAKEDIMLPIDLFLHSLRERTQQEVEVLHKKIETIYVELAVLFTLGFILLLMVGYVVHKKVLSPIEYLHRVIVDYRNNTQNIQKKSFYKDEIGQMIEQFFEMKEKIEDDKAKLQTMAVTDPLTKIYNRRAFFEMAESFYALAKRERKEFSILIVDIDFFKKINDTYGHIVGDRVLQHLVQTIEKLLRKSDIFARYGGEEFIIMLPNTGESSAQNVANKICKTVENRPYIDEEADLHIKITVSVGYSVFHHSMDTLNDVILRADTALYKAKKEGRNRFEKG